MSPQQALVATLALIALAASLLATSTPQAVAQNETTTTTTTTTTTYTTITNTTTTTTTEYEITIVNVTFTERPEGYVNAFFYNDSYIELIYTCYHLTTECPALRYQVIWNNYTFYEGVFTQDNMTCNTNTSLCQIAALFQVNSTKVTISYTYIYSPNDTAAYRIVLNNPRISQYPPMVQYILGLLPFVIFAGLALRTDPVMAGIGMIVSALIIYVASLYGMLPNVGPVLPVALTLGAVLLWTARR